MNCQNANVTNHVEKNQSTKQSKQSAFLFSVFGKPIVCDACQLQFQRNNRKIFPFKSELCLERKYGARDSVCQCVYQADLILELKLKKTILIVHCLI